MRETLQIQITLNATGENVFRALTADLTGWFSEHADVSLAEQRYDFWGRFTPDTPDRERGRHMLNMHQVGHSLSYDWLLRSEQTTVHYHLEEHADNTTLYMRQNGSSGSHNIGEYTFEDFWFLSLENLRRYLDGKLPVRCDFSTLPKTGNVRHTVEIDALPEVVYEVLIKPDQLNRWIASHAIIEPHVGGVYNIGWGAGVGPLKILELVPNAKLAYSWAEEPPNAETVVTWTLEGSGGKTRLTLVHSGFADDTPTGGIQAGWLNFSSWVKSIAEYGSTWQPAIKLIPSAMLPYYPASIGVAQDRWSRSDE